MKIWKVFYILFGIGQIIVLALVLARLRFAKDVKYIKLEYNISIGILALKILLIGLDLYVIKLFFVAAKFFVEIKLKRMRI
jgi:hypothetical protein